MDGFDRTGKPGASCLANERSTAVGRRVWALQELAVLGEHTSRRDAARCAMIREWCVVRFVGRWDWSAPSGEQVWRS
jgi:hypothetical protein